MDTTRGTELEPPDYGELLEQVKQRVRQARVQAARTVTPNWSRCTGRWGR